MAKILGAKTLKLRTRFQILKVDMDIPDPYSNEDYDYVESIAASDSAYSGFRYITGLCSQSGDIYSSFWLLSLNPRRSISEKDLQMFKDVIHFSQI